MTTVTRVQVATVAKYFSLFLFGVTLLGALASFVAVGDIIVSWPIFVVNLIVSGLLAWYFYKQRSHPVFSYDGDGYRLDVGRRRMSGEWRAYSTVSLVHKGGGEFVVRLRQDGESSIELPVSALGLNPQEFRFLVMRYVRGEGVENEEQVESSVQTA